MANKKTINIYKKILDEISENPNHHKINQQNLKKNKSELNKINAIDLNIKKQYQKNSKNEKKPN